MQHFSLTSSICIHWLRIASPGKDFHELNSSFTSTFLKSKDFYEPYNSSTSTFPNAILSFNPDIICGKKLTPLTSTIFAYGQILLNACHALRVGKSLTKVAVYYYKVLRVFLIIIINRISKQGYWTKRNIFTIIEINSRENILRKSYRNINFNFIKMFDVWIFNVNWF